ncbi:cytochrome c family protein [Sphingorhabdus lutea]|uniref:Cytochrome c family protein n=1 Tax=Sphingorhabdus lutea TaxID=1913578 RepID=A0A1L3JDU8_9SPHN|nr:cytochrome c family protein [Sphingorhabdus lutea]APG63286.1 cytochrome c family protein [Sphingorhabdus lutea]
MDNRSNTIAGWVLGGGIVALGLYIASSTYFHAGEIEEGKAGYSIEGLESGGEGGGESAVPLATLLASGDIAKGETIFKKCASCHTATQGGAHGIGPNLWGTMGKPHAGHAGFDYSPALKAVQGPWSFEEMDKWLTSPKKYADGTKMSFAGLGKPQERADLILYLNSLGSNLPLPAAPAAGEAAPAEGDAAAAPAEGEAAPAAK